MIIRLSLIILNLSFRYNILTITIALLQRYYYYIQKGIDARQVAGPPPGQMSRVKTSLPEKLRADSHLTPLLAELENEVLNDYDFSYRKSISMENQSLHIRKIKETMSLM